MIIDAITDIKNIMKVSPNFSRASHKMAKTTFSLFEDFNESLVFEVNAPDDVNAPDKNFAWITVDITETCKVNELIYDVTASTTPYVKCFYSYEGKIWEEFPYFNYRVVNTSSLTTAEADVLNQFRNTVFKKIQSSTTSFTAKDDRGVVTQTYVPKQNYLYIAYDPISKTTIPLKEFEYETLAKAFNQLFVDMDRSVIDFIYTYKYLNPTTNEIHYIYEDLYVRHLRLEFSQYLTDVVPFSLNKLSFLTPLEISVDRTVVSCFSDMMYKPKYFEDNTFLPSLTKTFLEMLEFSDKSISKKIPTLEIDFLVDNYFFNVFLFTNIEINISREFEPSYVWTIVTTNKQGNKSFSSQIYDSILPEWPKVDTLLYNLINDKNNISMEITFSIVTNKMTLEKTRFYDLTKPYQGDGWYETAGVGAMIIEDTFIVRKDR
jgi:hypothetical protein